MKHSNGVRQRSARRRPARFASCWRRRRPGGAGTWLGFSVIEHIGASAPNADGLEVPEQSDSLVITRMSLCIDVLIQLLPHGVLTER